MLGPIRLDHPFSSFVKITENGMEKAVPRPSPGETWEMEKALHIIEYHLRSEETARRKGLAIFIDRWASRFMLCEDRELRRRFSAALARSYEYRHFNASTEIIS